VCGEWDFAVYGMKETNIIIIIIIQESEFRKAIWKDKNKNVEGGKEE